MRHITTKTQRTASEEARSVSNVQLSSSEYPCKGYMVAKTDVQNVQIITCCIGVQSSGMKGQLEKRTSNGVHLIEENDGRFL